MLQRVTSAEDDRLVLMYNAIAKQMDVVLIVLR